MLIILSAWLCLILLMCAVWLYYRITANPSMVDVAWSIGHWIAGTIFLFANGVHIRVLLLWIVLTIWALRLAGYLYWTRIRVGIIDKRYTTLSQQWRIAPAIGFFFNFQLQGLLILLTLTSLYFNGQAINTALGWLDGIGLLLSVIGIVFCSIADLQLRHFVQNHPGDVCDVGLWKYSRHPNYFFEWLVWVGFALTALSAHYGWLGLISPLTLYVIMTRITGPMTENASKASKGKKYEDYQAKTPMFFPF